MSRQLITALFLSVTAFANAQSRKDIIQSQQGAIDSLHAVVARLRSDIAQEKLSTAGMQHSLTEVQQRLERAGRRVDSVATRSDLFEQQVKALTSEEVQDERLHHALRLAGVRDPDQQIFTIVEEMPSFPGGEAALFKYLGQTVQYPAVAEEAGITGVVYMTFVLDEQGKVLDPKVLRGIGGGCDEEAIRVVKAMPNWIPGKQRGKPVWVQHNMPIWFTRKDQQTGR